MAQITIEYDGRDVTVRKLLDALFSIKSVKVKMEESTYDPEFVKKVKKNEKAKGVVIKTEDLWK